MTVCGKSLVTELSENGVSGLNETQVSGLSEIQVSDLSEISHDDQILNVYGACFVRGKALRRFTPLPLVL